MDIDNLESESESEIEPEVDTCFGCSARENMRFSFPICGECNQKFCKNCLTYCMLCHESLICESPNCRALGIRNNCHVLERHWCCHQDQVICSDCEVDADFCNQCHKVICNQEACRMECCCCYEIIHNDCWYDGELCLCGKKLCGNCYTNKEFKDSRCDDCVSQFRHCDKCYEGTLDYVYDEKLRIYLCPKCIVVP